MDSIFDTIEEDEITYMYINWLPHLEQISDRTYNPAIPEYDKNNITSTVTCIYVYVSVRIVMIIISYSFPLVYSNFFLQWKIRFGQFNVTISFKSAHISFRYWGFFRRLCTSEMGNDLLYEVNYFLEG
jgi:hypothetical protein